jgi:hypothetical protein
LASSFLSELLRYYADDTLSYRPGSLPGGLAVAWVSTWIWALIFRILPFVFLLFPMAGYHHPDGARVLLLLSATSLLLRFRRAHREERQQLKWVAYTASLIGLQTLVGPWLPVDLNAVLSTLLNVAWSTACSPPFSELATSALC